MLIGAVIGIMLFLFSQRFLPVFNETSKNPATKEVNFLSIDCANKDICAPFGIRKYPTLKTFYKGKELQDEPARDPHALVELCQKLTSESYLNLNSPTEVKEFFKKYPESSFLFIYDSKESEFYKCMLSLSENPLFKPSFYFAAIQKDNYTNDTETIPKIETSFLHVLF
jgi:hypothetical protein